MGKESKSHDNHKGFQGVNSSRPAVQGRWPDPACEIGHVLHISTFMKNYTNFLTWQLKYVNMKYALLSSQEIRFAEAK